MSRWFCLWFGMRVRIFRSRRSLLLENLALRQQLTVLKRKHPKPKLRMLDILFWVVTRRFWSGWKQSLIVVTPETVVRWHRAGFRLYWSFISKVRKRVGRKRLSKEVKDLIFRVVAENPTWGAPRIHGELLMLGFDVSERSISRWMKRAPRDPEPGRRWLAFLRNHREAIAAMDFFTVPTVTFSLLYGFFVIGHDRRRVLHLNVKCHPTSSWIVQQLREAIRSMSITCLQTSVRSPWQNGVAERWVGSCRRDLLDHVIALNERHLRRLLAQYVSYYHDDRTHLGLGKETLVGESARRRRVR